MDKVTNKLRNPYLEGVEGERVAILDSGYLQLIEHYGCDERIIEAARMSTGKGFKGWGPLQCPCVDIKWHPDALTTGVPSWPMSNPLCEKCGGTGQVKGDEGLLSYLYTNKHATPFEMAGMVIEVQAPIMVFREWHRHRTQSYNEMSARYTPLPDVNYLPTPERCLVVAGKNKQAQGVGTNELTHDKVLVWLEDLDRSYRYSEEVYQRGLGMGIPKELARLCVPVGRYSRMRACANLRNWLAFLTLRMDHNAQYEIRMFANEVGRLVSRVYPRTWELFVEGKPYKLLMEG